MKSKCHILTRVHHYHVSFFKTYFNLYTQGP